MRILFIIATAAALVAGSLPLHPALAAPAKEEAGAAAAPRKWNISPEAREPLRELDAAVKGKDSAAYATKLAAAQAAVRTNDDKYALAQLMLQHSLDTNDVPGQIAALQAAEASGALDAADVTNVNRSLGILAANASNWPLAESALTAATAANAGDVDSLINLARAKIELNKPVEALSLLRRGIALTTAAGKPAPESWYRNALKLAYSTRDDAAVAEIDDQLLTLFPTQANFTNALAIYRASGKLPSDSEIDLLRLMQASGTAGKDEYSANVLKPESDRASLPAEEAEARAAGSSRLALNTGNAYYGYGEYVKAAELFRVALSKPDVDASLANLRLGEALAMAGDKAGAAAALNAVTGPRAELAALWRTWAGMPH